MLDNMLPSASSGYMAIRRNQYPPWQRIAEQEIHALALLSPADGPSTDENREEGKGERRDQIEGVAGKRSSSWSGRPVAAARPMSRKWRQKKENWKRELVGPAGFEPATRGL